MTNKKIQELESKFEALKKELEALKTPAKTKEAVFAEMVAKIDVHRPVVDFERYPSSMFWLDKDGNYWFEYDFKNKHLWCDYDKVWAVFNDRFGMKFNDIQSFINEKVEEHFKLKGVTPVGQNLRRLEGVEGHFKNIKTWPMFPTSVSGTCKK